MNRRIVNAVITSADMIVSEDNRAASPILDLLISRQQNTTASFGGQAVTLFDKSLIGKSIQQSLEYASLYYQRFYHIIGTRQLSQCVGRTVRVEIENNRLIAIGHTIDEIWLNPLALEAEVQGLIDNDKPVHTFNGLITRLDTMLDLYEQELSHTDIALLTERKVGSNRTIPTTVVLMALMEELRFAKKSITNNESNAKPVDIILSNLVSHMTIVDAMLLEYEQYKKNLKKLGPKTVPQFIAEMAEKPYEPLGGPGIEHDKQVMRNAGLTPNLTADRERTEEAYERAIREPQYHDNDGASYVENAD